MYTARTGMADTEPARISNYDVVGKIGQGGMGVVYEGRHLFMGRIAAIKLLHPHLCSDAGLVRRFLNEARAADAIKHPHIIEVYDSGLSPAPYLVMERLVGESLAERIQRGRLSLADVLEVSDQIASALGAAHGRNIVHRDLKPDNLFLVAGAARVSVKVLDFGIAKLSADLLTDRTETQPGRLLGTLSYMSPEQIKASAAVDHRSDIYSLGVILFELLCGRRPFVETGLAELVVAHSMRPPPRPSSIDARVSPALDAIVLRALAKDPAERFASMEELRQALASAGASLKSEERAPGPADEATLAAAKTLDAVYEAPLPPRPPRRWRAALAVVVLAGVGAAVALVTRGEAPTAIVVPGPETGSQQTAPVGGKLPESPGPAVPRPETAPAAAVEVPPPRRETAKAAAPARARPARKKAELW